MLQRKTCIVKLCKANKGNLHFLGGLVEAQLASVCVEKCYIKRIWRYYVYKDSLRDIKTKY